MNKGLHFKQSGTLPIVTPNFSVKEINHLPFPSAATGHPAFSPKRAGRRCTFGHSDFNTRAVAIKQRDIACLRWLCRP